MRLFRRKRKDQSTYELWIRISDNMGNSMTVASADNMARIIRYGRVEPVGAWISLRDLMDTYYQAGSVPDWTQIQFRILPR